MNLAWLCLPLAAALTRNEGPVEFDFGNVKGEEGKAVKQYLHSDEGMAYYGVMYVGGQPQQGIYDTGSFNLVVQSKCNDQDEATMRDNHPKKKWSFKDKENLDADAICCVGSKCPRAAYDLSKGQYTQNSPRPSLITYGSGDVVITHATDHVMVDSSEAGGGKLTSGKIGLQRMPVEVIVDHAIDLFRTSQLQAIVGLGPGAFEERADRLTTQMGIKRFTMCFQEDVHQPGIMTWNDKSRSGHKGWVDVPVIGKSFWAVKTTAWNLIDHTGQKNGLEGCNPSCGAIVDSGTSLITVPDETVASITSMVVHGHIQDCSDLSKFPTFSFKFGDTEFTLPPAAYIYNAGWQDPYLKVKHLAFPLLPLDKEAANQLRLARLQGETGTKINTCALMVQKGDAKEKPTPWGPMVIMGMALFRKYSIQFDLTKDFENVAATKEAPTRMMRFFEADSDCHDKRSNGMSFQKIASKARLHNKLQSVNLDKIRVSPLQRQLNPHSEAAELHTEVKSREAFSLAKEEFAPARPFDQVVQDM